ncbi:HEAT repeat domain-containing protein [Nostoc cycadae]|uniref:PBS lyase HEAT-like repeat domain protein n=1 Tax=Nostoc cycadae WK-1 TaxID=1861711 RepID=A0A2H6LCH9_9NOSO|nr:HEAT repeat domain-containing protein [Nostoc cycadae]GBE90945.1 PBS lyase HEAT-like repeat domain protein [Nostoc cycadae WK-1]
MPSTDKLLAIFDRIVEGKNTTKTDIEQLRRSLKIVEGVIQLVSQNGKFNSNIGQITGGDIHIGDRIYQGVDVETLKKVLQTPTPPPLSQEEQKNAVLEFLQAIENNFKYLKLFHTLQPIVLKRQYIPIQVTLERRYKHEVETTWSYAESAIELKKVYALKGFDEELQRREEEKLKKTIVSWEEAKEEIRKDAKKRNYQIMVLAEPGMGKSTLLKMELGAASQSERQKLLENQIHVESVIFPIFLRLSELLEDSAEVIDIIPNIIQKEYPLIADNIQPLLKEKLKNGKCLLLLDALDEVPNQFRLSLKDKLNRFTRNYPCSIISTSRIVGYGGNFFEDAKEVEIVPFSQKQTQDYIETWFANAADYIEDDSVSAQGLIAELEHKPQIGGLAQNPLLLSLLCSLYQEKGITLPARRIQVYEKTVDYMLSKWSQNRNYSSDGEIEAKRRLLEEIAYSFSASDQEIFSSSELYEQIKKIYQVQDDKVIDKAMTELTQEYGILQKLNREGNDYLFLHRTFQEYFTACYLKRVIEQNQQQGIALAKKLFWRYDWHETLTLLTGLLKDPVILLQAIVNEKDDIFQTLLLLAGRCIAEIPDKPASSITNIISKIYKFWRRYPNVSFINSTVIALGKSNSQICDELKKALNHSSRYVRSKAAEALGNIGNPQAVDALISALNDSDSDVRSKAAEALGNIGNLQAVDALISALNDSERYVRSNAVEALGKIGNLQAVDALISALNDSERYVRSNAVEALTKIENPQEVAEDLIAALKDSNSYVRRKATEALGKIGNPQGIDSIKSALNDPDSYVKWLAAWALAEIDNPQAIDALISALNDTDSFMKCLTAWALAKIGNFQAVHSLFATLDDLYNDPDVKTEAVEVLISALDDLYNYLDVKWLAAEVLVEIGNPQVVDALIAAFNDPHSYFKSEVAEALGKIGNPQAVDALISAFNDDIAAFNDSDIYTDWTRKAAVEALGKIGNPQAVDGLISALNDSNKDVRSKAAEALGKIGNPQAVDALISAFNDDIAAFKDSDIYTDWTREAAVEALGKIGNPQAVDALISALYNLNWSVRHKAVEALGKIGNPQAVNALISALSHFIVREEAAEALGKIGNQEILEKIIQLPEIDIYEPEIFSLARMITVRFSRQKLSCIPVYPEKIKFSPIIATFKHLRRGIPFYIKMIFMIFCILRKKLSE